MNTTTLCFGQYAATVSLTSSAWVNSWSRLFQLVLDPSSHITINDIAVDDDRNPAMIQFTLKASKTDPFRKGVQVAVGKTENDICPVRVLMEFLAVRGSKPGPLFCSQNSSPFICSQFVGKIKKALQ